MYLFSQILAFFAFVLVVVSLQLKNKSLFLCQFVSNLLYALSFLMLNSFSGFVVAFAGSLRFAILFFANKKNIKHNDFLLLVILLLYVFGLYCCFSVWLDLILFCSAIVYSILCWVENPFGIRVGSMLVSTTIIVTNIVCKNYVAVLMEAFSIFSALLFLCQKKRRPICLAQNLQK